jgi:riboflavin kinase / FMN adenylyltransferase
MGARTIHRISDLADLPASLRGGVVAIGNFDGVHRGHLSVLERALQEAHARGAPTLVLTFEPHPRVFFRPDMPLFRLTPAPLKAHILSILGVDAVVELAFDEALSQTSAEDFVKEILHDGLGISHAVTGFDFHFGKGREGEVAEAAGLLGYRFTIEAEVSHGQKLGRTLGFPTANMALPDSTALKHGIYAVRLRRPDGSLHDGVASFGRRPTVEENGAVLLETFIFDFTRDIYGETCTVSFFGFLRPELKFEGLEPLVAQIARDVEEAKALLSGVRPLSEVDLALGF